MCGRYSLTQSSRELQAHFHLFDPPLEFSATDIRPTDLAPIIRQADDRRLALPARWGLIPSWSKDERIAQHTFNARAETLAEKPSFRAAFKRRRCLVPASAFFEWRTVPGEKKKQKLRFAAPDGQPLALAGLWETWRHPETDATIDTYTIVTTAANAFMAPIHDRMPAILTASDWDAWLDPEVGNPLLLQGMLQPWPDDGLRMEAG